ncbi:hypothetical protein PV08_03594 [Exophiala spinifera]|uniref:Myb-like domain-containing protein n=1 Tax=Exophiala spinifera TaxID=91928 RepID=A0A0D2BL23_9EURO|nr:uncharacterized protein PV08_03594 [Exophiala spinifera]KIW19300.1 hypothetical protein PV08_03594 [Exophiala spinifera]
MSSPPPPKKQKQTQPITSSNAANKEVSAPQTPLAPKPNSEPLLMPATDPGNPRKRGRATPSPKLNTLPPQTGLPPESPSTTPSVPGVPINALLSDESGKKRSRTNTPWTPQEEQRLKQMRDAGHSWSEIAKVFGPDMHYAEFAEDEARFALILYVTGTNLVQSAALREAIKEYDANKWKAIGQKLGKPAKACEQYAREHFRNG